MTTTERIRTAFESHGVTGALHAVDLRTGAEVNVDADLRLPLASVFKVALVTALFRAADRGLDLTQSVEVKCRTAGPTGLGAMHDPARLSLRDLAYLAIALSDNGAADVILDWLGLEAVNAVHEHLGMTATVARHRLRDFTASLLEDTGADDVAAATAALAADHGLLQRLRVRDPDLTNAGSARDQTRLLGALWRDEAASPRSCAAIRRLLALQVWPHRLASGFPDADTAVAGKTGTLPGIRNEVGVVEGPGARAVAIAVLTVSPSASTAMPHLDALIGASARIAWEGLPSAPRP